MRIIAIQENEKTKKQSEDKITKAIKGRIVRDIRETFQSMKKIMTNH